MALCWLHIIYHFKHWRTRWDRMGTPTSVASSCDFYVRDMLNLFLFKSSRSSRIPNTETPPHMLYWHLSGFCQLTPRPFNYNRRSCTNYVFWRNEAIISLYPFQSFSWDNLLRWSMCPIDYFRFSAMPNIRPAWGVCNPDFGTVLSNMWEWYLSSLWWCSHSRSSKSFGTW
jgi:hypothetical protein